VAVPFNLAELRDFLHIATEALSRYKLRTSLSVLGAVLGVAAVIAMMSVSEGAAREALSQVEALGLDNLVARSQVSGATGPQKGLQAGDAAQVAALVPHVRVTSPLIDRFLRISHAEKAAMTRERGSDPNGGTLAWHDLNEVALVPLPALSGRTLEIAPQQPADEVWVQIDDGERSEELAAILTHVLRGRPGGREFNVVVPRELLAQRYRTQRTFSIVVGSVAALALIVGGIGIMNIMLTSVIERTREIGVRRTVGATRRDVTIQFLIEALMMTIGGGALGIVVGVVVSFGITAFAGWATRVSPLAVVLAFAVSFGVGLVFGLYPAMKAAALEPVDAMRYE
jgi:ABC-type antimicrobial peptide transport system permease subunit